MTCFDNYWNEDDEAEIDYDLEEDEMSETSVPRSQDFIYASFVEVVCPLCDEGALFDTKADARQWARGHKADHIDGSVARRHCGWE